MTALLSRTPLRGVALLLPLLAAACTDSTPLTPTLEPAPAEILSALQCTVEVSAAAMICENVETGGALQNVSAGRMVGGQNRHVRLSNSGNSYDAGTQIFSTNVTIQNLTPQALGLDSLGNVTGVMVFFDQAPADPVTVANETGTTYFTAANQDYFLYNQALGPNEISAPLQWQFNVPGPGTSFTFMVYVWADQPDKDASFTDELWTGAVSSDWSTGANWLDGTAPTASSSVQIRAAAAYPVPNQPVLTGDAQIGNLEVGVGSTLSLAGYTLTASGNVDATGAVTGGRLQMSGTGVVLGGNLPGVVINGGTSLQRSTVASGAVSISDGSLVVNGSKPLSISIP